MSLFTFVSSSHYLMMMIMIYLDLNDDDDDDEIEETKLQIPADIDKSSDSIEKSILLSLETVKKPPLKLVIKRLQHSTRSASN